MRLSDSNNKRLWFKRKTYGYGWTPSSLEGWLVTLGYVLVIVYDFRRIDAISHSASDTLLPFFIDFIIATSIFVFICYKKGEKPKWQWGKKY